MTNLLDLKNRLFDLEADVLALHPIAGVGSEIRHDWMEDFCERLDPDAPILQQFPELGRHLHGDRAPLLSDLRDELLLNNRTGFIVRAAWCAREYLSDSAFASGPGRWREEWFYAETVEAAFAAVIAAAEADHEKARAKAGAA